MNCVTQVLRVMESKAKPPSGPWHVCGVFAPEKGLDHRPVAPVPCEWCDAEMCETCPRAVCLNCHRSLLACLRCATKMGQLCINCVASTEPILNTLKLALPEASTDVLRLVTDYQRPRCHEGKCDASAPFVPFWRCNQCLKPSCEECESMSCDKHRTNLLLCTSCFRQRSVVCPTCNRTLWCHEACGLVPMQCCNDVKAPLRCTQCTDYDVPYCETCRVVLCPECVARATKACDGCHKIKQYCALHWNAYACSGGQKSKVLCRDCAPFWCTACNKVHCTACTGQSHKAECIETSGERATQFHSYSRKRKAQ